jgi:hypothetical protein
VGLEDELPLESCMVYHKLCSFGRGRCVLAFNGDWCDYATWLLRLDKKASHPGLSFCEDQSSGALAKTWPCGPSGSDAEFTGIAVFSQARDLSK